MPTLRLKRGSDNVKFVTTFEFPKVLLLALRNVFPLTASNKLDISVPICTRTANISFTKMKYLTPGANPNNNANYFKDVDVYQYLLPPGVTPISGLTPVVGLPNHYSGTNNVTVQINSAFNNETVQVRGISNTCNNVSTGLFNNINFIRQLPILNGPGTIRCGETDTKTFQVGNLPTTNNCITSYTWQIANKGWKYNGSIPTANVVTTTPSIQLVSADNTSAPPQNISVVMAEAGGQTITATRSISFIAPSIAIAPIYTSGFDCNSLDFTATVVNAPLNSFDYIWTSFASPGNSLINGLPSPQTTAINNASLYRDPSYTDPVGIVAAVNASCGIISSPVFPGFGGCFPWPNYTVYGFADPLNGGGNIIANIEGLVEAIEYEWYAFYQGQYHYMAVTYSPYLQESGAGFPNVDNIGIYERAKTYSGYTQLKEVGGFCNSGGCGYSRMGITNPIKIYPNPAISQITVSINSIPEKELIKVPFYIQKNKNIPETEKISKEPINQKAASQKLDVTKVIREIRQIKIINSMGLVQKQIQFGKGNKTVTLYVTDLKDGVYTLEVSDGVTTSKTTLLIKR